MDIEQLAELLL